MVRVLVEKTDMRISLTYTKEPQSKFQINVKFWGELGLQRTLIPERRSPASCDMLVLLGSQETKKKPNRPNRVIPASKAGRLLATFLYVPQQGAKDLPL